MVYQDDACNLYFCLLPAPLQFTEVEAIAVGDPHYTTFDGRHFTAQGYCEYLLSSDCMAANSQFEVVLINGQSSSTYQTARTEAVRVTLGSTVILLQRDRQQVINNIRVETPAFLANDVSVRRSGGQTSVLTNIGVRVKWDGSSGVKVLLNGTLFNSMVCGLGGDSDGDTNNDFTSSAGSLSSMLAFADSYIVNPTECLDTTINVASPCNSSTSVEAASVCNDIIRSDGPFAACAAAMPTYASNFYSDCQYDVCVLYPDTSGACDIYAAFVDTCNARGYPPSDWRSASLCPLTCPPNSTYGTCISDCEVTCSDVRRGGQLESACNGLPCVEGCICDVGFYQDGNVCVPEAECGCNYNGIYYMYNETFITEGCIDICTCGLEGVVTCDLQNCSVNSVCAITNYAYGCACAESYEGDGITCDRVCPSNLYRCPEGTCIPSDWVCDGFPGDCLNFYDEDETLCCNVMNVTDHCPKPDHFRCIDGIYIPNSYLCDAVDYDCSDNQDESEEICFGTCPNPGDIVNGRTGPQKSLYRDGESIFFQCFAGYTRIGPSYITCNLSLWSDQLPVCLENCIIPIPPANGFIDAMAFNHSDVIGFSCEVGYDLVPAGTLLACDSGVVNGTVPDCIDINECASTPCMNGGTCLNQVNQYTCICTVSWTGDNCDMDIDECTLGLDTCSASAACSNTIGSYTCACLDGYRGDGFDCKEIILLPFGPDASDELLRDTFDQSSVDSNRRLVDQEMLSRTIRPETGFPFGGTFYPALYFMDNGLIIFMNENDLKLGYPNPFSDGFSDINTVPMVAPFWADTDLTTSQGEVYYKIYQPSTSATDDAILAEASGRVRDQYSEFSNFNASWMIVITWENMPSFIQQNETNTFQAVLLTDGIFSFCIFNYREGEMLWDYDSLASQDVIIGYNDGAGLYVNSQFLNPPFATGASSFRPDQFNGNTNLKGRWIYRLENNTIDTINPKRFCLDWYNTQPDPSDWDRFLGACPCSFSQGGNDRSYSRRAPSRGRVSSAASRRFSQELLAEIESFEGPFCLQTSVPPFDTGGMRCCYREDQSLIVGYETDYLISVEERYQYNYQGDSYEVLLSKWLLEDFSPRHYCCKESNDEAFCNMYFEKRPAGSCSGYLPPRTGWMVGDPHIETLDEILYTFNGLGEYIQVKFPDVSGGNVFELQGRTARAMDTVTQQLTDATVFVAFVAKAKDAQTVQMTMNADGTDVDIVVDNVAFDKNLFVDGVYLFSNNLLQISVETVANSTQQRYVAYWTIGMSIAVRSIDGVLDMVFSAPDEYKDGSSRGLLGVWNDDPSDDFRMQNEVLLTPTGADGTYTDPDYFMFGETWRTTTSDSLFFYTPGTSWSSYNDPTFTPLFLDQLIASTANDDPAFLQESRDMCGTDNQCLFDALATKSLTRGVDTKVQSEENVAEARNLANFPPNITGSNLIEARVGVPFTLETTSFDPEGQAITFSLTQMVPNATISQAGVFDWNPSDLNKVRVGIRAFDGETNSVLEPTVKICDCQNGGTCVYDQYTDTSNIVVDKFAVVVCACDAAWTGDFCEVDRNGCEDGPCFPGITCVDNIAPLDGNTCGPCPTGLEGNGFKCYDFDECADPNGSPCEQICNNMLGGFTCSCMAGYELHPDQRTCLDIDECDLQTDNCHAFATCSNTPGSFTCTCVTGYSDVSGDGTVCEDINECFNEVTVCELNSNCENTIGSYSCICNLGFEKINGICSDINECQLGMANCSPQGDCTNTEGSFVCKCRSGFDGDGLTCENIDECTLAVKPCHPRAACEDTFGSYICSCDIGQIGDGIACSDVDECVANTDECSPGEAICSNTLGSYECRCYEGYSGNGFQCFDINECELNSTICSINANCVNSVGSYSCACKEGYFGDGSQCFDIDECAEGTDTCNDTTGVCNNNAGSYSCMCSVGYTGDGRTCNDVDECALTTDDCQQMCTNSYGSFVCSCRQGFTIDMTETNICLDMDECALGIDNCTQVCNNTEGSFECLCFDGFKFDNQGMCVPDSVCINKVCTNGDCYVMNGNELCSCYNGYKLDANDDSLCINIDECTDALYQDACSDICIDADPGYTCDCNPGFILTTGGRICNDINECTEGTSSCDAVSENCFNTAGGFVCTCKTGFLSNGTMCSDINECEGTNLCSANALCTNTPGSYSCACNAGYAGNGENCVEINECDRASLNDCSENALCTNLPGFYQCDCLTGFDGNGTFCIDIDECDTNPCESVVNARCQNVAGSYNCVCKTDFYDFLGVCTAGVSKTVYALFTDIIGFEVNDIQFQINDTSIYEVPLAIDLDAAFNASMLRDYQAVFVNSISMAGNVARVLMTLTFLPNSSVTDQEITDAFVSQLTGRFNNVILPDNKVYNQTFAVGDPIIDPCLEGTYTCGLNADCVFSGISNNHTCMCSAGWTGDAYDACTDIDECLSLPCTGRGEMCVNSLGSYQCVCRNEDGFHEFNGACVMLITYRGEFTIFEVNRLSQAAQFIPALEDSTTPEFLDLSLKVCGVIRYTMLLERSLQDFYYECEVMNFTMADPSGTHTSFLVIFRDNVTTSSAEIEQLVRAQLDSDSVIVSGTKTLGNLTLDPSSINIGDINPLCTDDYCLYDGICENIGSYPDLTRNCMCPMGYSGSRCEIVPTTPAPSTATIATEPPTEPVTISLEPTTEQQTTISPDGGLTALQLLGIGLGVAAFVLLVILLCLCMLVILRRRQAEARRRDYFRPATDRAKIFYNPPLGATRISEYRRTYQPEDYLGIDNESVSDNSSFIATLGYRSEEESRMRHLANVITQSPYLNERMRARISSMVPQEAPSLPDTEFIRPYVATGREAAEVHRNPDGETYRPSSITLPDRQSSFTIPRAQFYWDDNTESYT
ncbi:uncharacterized protein LOC117302931 isoform X2 [Asterias rubens]|uniref:uncharacterized protein LOC117302931 isoform X2 n=1 Tax=Asterias rubens TaxID=7604 RepID=UPI0014557F97|nr:uncharacterized protein LOC117302931 isoform X2 [Asterias rubens]